MKVLYGRYLVGWMGRQSGSPERRTLSQDRRGKSLSACFLNAINLRFQKLRVVHFVIAGVVHFPIAASTVPKPC